MERAWAELKMGASGEPVFGFAASSTLPFIAHGGLVEQASVATIRKAAMQLAMQLRRPHPGGPENHAVSAARSGNAAAGTVGMRRCCPIVVTPLVQWRSDIWVILLVI